MDIGIQYISGILSSEQLEEISALCEKGKLDLEIHDITGRAYASGADLTQFFIVLSPVIIESISSGIISNVSYDIIKAVIFKCANAISGKTYFKQTSSKKVSAVAKFYLRSSKSELFFEIPANSTKAIEKSIKKLVAAYEKDQKGS